ncbi:MAG TPA: hypothetical protein VH253_02080 [Phycisphaerae bacterium]|nr:hypothetical protein [Phycisphaerae bacterium]
MARMHWPARAAAAATLLTAATAMAQGTQPATQPAATWAAAHWTVGVDARGMIVSIVRTDDPAHMNWVRDDGPAWGMPLSKEAGKLTPWGAPEMSSSGAGGNELRFTHGALKLTLKQTLNADSQLEQRYTLTNTSGGPVALAEGDFGLCVPLPDNYPSAEISLTQRCDTHLWMGGSAAWINAIRMNGTAPELGLVLEEGSLTAYSITDRPWNSNDRGFFVVHPAARTLGPGESMTLAWRVFWHQDWHDFFAEAQRVPGFVRLQADRYTVFPGEAVHITAQGGGALAGAAVTVNGQPVAAQIQGDHLSAEFTPAGPGDQRVELALAGRTAWMRAYASPDPMALIAARCRFIIDHQQKHTPGEAIDGALLAYDNQTKELVLEKSNDRNAGRERVGMGVLLALYVPRCGDAALKARIDEALNVYWKFVSEHLQGADGTVYNNTDDPKQRLYNYPWVAMLHLAMFQAYGDGKYLDAFVRTVRSFYAHGGAKMYPIDLPIREGLAALTKAGRTQERDELLGLFRGHADRMIQVGTAMPKSEVNYEQSIVAPACDVLLQVAEATGDAKYRTAAEPFVQALLAFNGQQPDHHLNDLGIRHWDDYWFGKGKLYGDTFPHYWSTLTGMVLADEARMEPGQADALRRRAVAIVANSFSLFSADGAASCAYVYPLTVNDRPGQFYDAWANDQDWALVHYLLLTR